MTVATDKGIVAGGYQATTSMQLAVHREFLTSESWGNGAACGQFDGARALLEFGPQHVRIAGALPTSM